jgi:hypothetical protein
MKSKTVERLLNETSEDVKKQVSELADKLVIRNEKINSITEILNRLIIHHGYSTDEAAEDIYELFNDNIGGQDESK